MTNLKKLIEEAEKELEETIIIPPWKRKQFHGLLKQQMTLVASEFAKSVKVEEYKPIKGCEKMGSEQHFTCGHNEAVDELNKSINLFLNK